MLKFLLMTTLLATVSPGFAQNKADTTGKAKHTAITIGVISVVDAQNRVAANPYVSGSIGAYSFENRYNYESPNSASFNMGKRLSQTVAGFGITPKAGVVVGDFRGLTTEIQADKDTRNWSFSIDNQYTFNYRDNTRSFFSSWTSARLKLTGFFQFGGAVLFNKTPQKPGVLDKGLCFSAAYRDLTLCAYGFNYQPARRNYIIVLTYPIKFAGN